jgi:hypothetical protein
MKMGHRYWVGIAVCILCWVSTPAFAMNASAEKIKAYAEIYPSFFKTTTQTVAYQPNTYKSQAVTLLLNSFNGTTDVDELSAVLRPSDQSALKPESVIRQLLQSKGIAWQEYQDITHTLASDPASFQMFISQLKQGPGGKEIMSKVYTDPSLMRDVRSTDHQIILKNLMLSATK